jgi:methionyl-tRNA formyltransferase
VRILFIGSVQFSLRTLSHLHDSGENIVGVITRRVPANPADHRDLSDYCERNSISWRYGNDINNKDSIGWIRKLSPDVIFCIGWPNLLKEEALASSKLGVIGYHPAAIPLNRGRHPIIWALSLGLSETASTFFMMDLGADSGPIISQEHVPIYETDYARDLYSRLEVIAVTQLDEILLKMSSGNLESRNQNLENSNLWRKRDKSDGLIDWRMSAKTIYNLVRALSAPYPGAHFMVRGYEVKAWKAELVNSFPANFEPGKVIATDKEGITVRCGEGAIRVASLEPYIEIGTGEYL